MESEREVILKEANDLTFMGLNIFAHDFLHDFNVVNFSARLSKISSDIDKLNNAIQNRTGATTTGGHLDTELFDVITLREEIKMEEEEGDDFAEYIEKADDLRKHKLLFSELSILFSELKILENKQGVITRSRAALIQKINQFIDETKLYVIGMMGNKNTLKGGKEDKATTTIFNFLSNQESIDNPVYTNIMNKNTTISIPYYDNIDIIVQNGISSTIEHCDTIQLTNYFTFMGELYLLLKNNKKNPFQTFNHPYLEFALFIYLLNKVLNKDKPITAKSVLEKIISSKKGGQKGGELPSLEELYRKKEEFKSDSFSQLYKYYFLNAEEEKDFNIGDIFTNEIIVKLFTNVDKFEIPITFITQNKTNTSLFTKKKINDLKSDLKYKYDDYRRTPSDNRNYEKYRLNLINAMKNYLFDYLYNLINQEIDKLEAELNVGPGTLNSTQKGDVQMISVIVARGGLNYINNGLKSQTITPNNEVLGRELLILENINEKVKVGGKLDENIKDDFKKYAERIAPVRTLTTYDEIKTQISNYKNKNTKIKVINNAADKKALEIMGMLNNTICPTSSVVDAMGSIGSCYGSTIKNQEYHPMNFRITNGDGVNYYQGQTVLTSKSGKVKEVKVIFSALFNEFFLPNVEIDIDITTSTVVTLSANTTFKQVINKILNIWARVFDGTFAPNPQVMWQTLESKSLFSELVSNGAIKSVGDLYQEINSVVEMGGYSNSVPNFYDSLRIGAMGDQPSGVRAGYLLLKASSGINDESSIAGYISPTDGKSVVISYNKIDENQIEKIQRKVGGKRKTNKKQRKQRKVKKTRKI